MLRVKGGGIANFLGFIWHPILQRITKRTFGSFEVFIYNKNYTDAQVETIFDFLFAPQLSVGVCGRILNINTFYFAIFESSSNIIRLGRMNAGSIVYILDYDVSTLTTISHFTDKKIKLYISGTDVVTLKVYLNDILIINTTDTSLDRIIEAGRWGGITFRNTTDNAYFKNLTIYNTFNEILETYDYSPKLPIWIIYNTLTPVVSLKPGSYGIIADAILYLVLHPFIISDVDITSCQRAPIYESMMMVFCCSNMFRDGYYFRWYYGKLQFIRVVSGTLTIIAEKTLAIDYSILHTLRLQKNGTTFNCWFDDILHPEFTNIIDNKIPNGWVGIIFGKDNELINFSASSIDTIPPADPTNVSSRYTPQGNMIIWTNPTDPDLRKIELQYSNNGIDWQNLASWDKIYGDILALANSYKDIALLGRYYRIRAIDTGNNPSNWIQTSAILEKGGSWVF
jgi:hypothetical protein